MVSRSTMPVQTIGAPQSVDKTVFDTLVAFWGFPAPFLKRSTQFSNVWKRLRKEQLFREDIRDLTHMQEIARLEILADLIRNQSGNLFSLSGLSQKVGVAANTIKRWMQTLESFYYCFLIRPYAQNVIRSLTKEPKVYMWDWSDVVDRGARYENFVASHLLKVPYAFQLVFDAPELIQNCFTPQQAGEVQAPLIVPVQTLLSQLL